MCKLWCYYLKRARGVADIYAYTSNSFLKNMFEQERNLDKFIKKKYEFEDIDELDLFVIHNFNCNKEMYKRKIQSDIGLIEVILTASEEETIFINGCDKIIKELSKYVDITYAEYFNSDLLKALNKLKYFQIAKIKEISENGFAPPFIDTMSTDFLFNDMIINEFNIMMMSYETLFKNPEDIG